MQRKLTKLWMAAALALFVGVGCTDSGSSGGGVFTNTTIDVAVGDKMMNAPVDDRGRILLWFDILSDLGSGNSTPDVIIDTADVDSPTRLTFWNGDLFVLNTGEFVGPTGNISIYRDYLTLNDDDAADVNLGNTGSGLADPKFMFIANNDLLVVDWGTDGFSTLTSDTAKIFRDVDTLVSGDAPDVTLNNATSLVAAPRSITVGGDDLYVGNWTQAGSNDCVLIFRDVATLADGDAPDAVLTDDVSFLDLIVTHTSGGCRDLLVDNDTLYVAYAYSDHLFIFNNASALTDDALPDVILTGFGTGSLLNTPTSIGIVNNNLFVTNHNFTDPGGTCCTPVDNLPGLVVFTGADALVDDDAPAVQLEAAQGLAYADRFATAGNTLFVTGGDDNVNSVGSGSHSSLFIFANALTANSIDDVTPLLIQGSDEGTTGFIFDYPTGLAATSR